MYFMEGHNPISSTHTLDLVVFKITEPFVPCLSREACERERDCQEFDLAWLPPSSATQGNHLTSPNQNETPHASLEEGGGES